MSDEPRLDSYPEGFLEWNNNLMQLFAEAADKYNPELVIGAIETVKILYLELAVNNMVKAQSKEMSEND